MTSKTKAPKLKISECPALSGQGVVAWVDRFVAKARLREYPHSGPQTSLSPGLAAACWWAAYRQALATLETCNAKDLTHMFVAGVGPFDGMAHVNDAVDDFCRDLGDDVLLTDQHEALRKELVTFFFGEDWL